MKRGDGNVDGIYSGLFWQNRARKKHVDDFQYLITQFENLYTLGKTKPFCGKFSITLGNFFKNSLRNKQAAGSSIFLPPAPGYKLSSCRH